MRLQSIQDALSEPLEAITNDNYDASHVFLRWLRR